MHALIREVCNGSICVKCNNTMFVETVSKVCGHVACKICFRDNNYNCPICNTILTKEDVSFKNDVKPILKSCSGFPVIEDSDIVPKVIYLFTPEKPKAKRNHEGEILLHKKCREGNLEEIEALILSGVDINVQDFANWAPLHEAVIANRLDVVKLLLDSGALVNVPGLKYKTALHLAVEQRSIPLVNLLVQYGGSTSSYNSDGKTPIDLCKSKDSRRLLSALCLTLRNSTLYTVFAIPNLVNLSTDVEDEVIQKIIAHPEVTELPVAFLSNDHVNYAIIRNKSYNTLHLQIAMLHGAFIFNAEGFFKFVENRKQNPFQYLVDLPKYAIHKAVMNKLFMLPPLFDSLHFYFNHTYPQRIGEFTYTVENFKQLVLAGGGVVLMRKPLFNDETKEGYSPYHSKKDSDLVCTTSYIIYDCKKKMLGLKNSPTVKYKSFCWFIDCINNFCIE